MVKTDLAPQLLVSGEVTIMAKSLFQKSQQDGDNDTRLQCLTKTDKEDFAIYRSISIVFFVSQTRKDRANLPGTAKTLTVMATSCDERADWMNSESNVKNVSIQYNILLWPFNQETDIEGEVIGRGERILSDHFDKGKGTKMVGWEGKVR